MKLREGKKSEKGKQSLLLFIVSHTESHKPHRPAVTENIISGCSCVCQNRHHTMTPRCSTNPSTIRNNVPVHFTTTPRARLEMPPIAPKQIMINPTFSIPTVHDINA